MSNNEGENHDASQKRNLEGIFSKNDERIMDESVIQYISMKNEKLANNVRNQLNVSLSQINDDS
jgi:hypothetical protein